MDRPVDANREIRAMILCALPYPPLPVCVRRFDDENRLGDEAVASSHDLISHMIEAAAARREDRAVLEQRRERQREVLRSFLAALVRDGPLAPPQLYRVYCTHTADHIAAYYPAGSAAPEIRFMPLEHVCRGDATHRRACDFVAAQARLLELQGGLYAQDWQTANYTDLLQVCRDRLVTEGDDKHIVPAETADKRDQ